LKGFWGNPWNPKIIDELAAPDILLRFSLHAPRRGRDDVRDFMVGFRKAFPDLNFWGAADLIAEGDYVVGAGKAAALTPDPPSAIFLWARSRQRLAERCGSPARLCFASRIARSQRKLVSTTG